ncbi:MAG: cytochrome b [Pseudomonadota bacterium]
MLRSTRQRFGSVAILFHWGIALGVVALYALGLYMDELEYQDPWFNSAMELHKGLGMLLFAAILARWLWRLVDVQPVPLETCSAFEQWSARVMKAVLYLLLVLVPLSGYLISSAEGQPIDVFGWFQVPALISGLPEQEDVAGEVHEFLSNLLIALAAVHALAAIKHHVFDHDDTLRRMTFRPLRSPPRE